MIVYNSHGCWSTLGHIREVEVNERGNYFPDIDFPDDTPAIWVCATRREASRYIMFAGEIDEREPTLEELNAVFEVELDGQSLIVSSDGEGGFLVIRLVSELS